MNLAIEYFLRRKSNSIMITNESYLLLEGYGILLISSHTKSIHCCSRCGNDHDSLIVELIRDQNLHVDFHSHIKPDFDLNEKIKEFNLGKPIKINNLKEVEIILWKIFKESNKINNVFMDPKSNAYQEMFNVAAINLKLYQQFYLFFCAVTSGRKYLLLDGN